MYSLFSSVRRSRPLNPHRPNLLEVTQTTLPLLSTVLAGFSVTIMVELITQPEAGQTCGLLNVGLTLLADICSSFFILNYFLRLGTIVQLLNPYTRCKRNYLTFASYEFILYSYDVPLSTP